MKSISLFAVVFIGFSHSGIASPLSTRLEKLVEEMSIRYSSRDDVSDRKTLAIMPLNSNIELSKARVGSALAELLTHQFSKRQEFRVIERLDVEKVLEEQNIQQSGAIAPDTAVRIGRLLGAQTLFLGSVDKLGGKYQVNTRLVDVENGEVYATGYQEISSRLFEEEAKPYLRYVPDYQTVGFYMAVIGTQQTKQQPSVPIPNGEAVLKPVTFNFFGGGIRYFPHPNLVLDGSYLIPLENYTLGTVAQNYGGGFTNSSSLTLSSSRALRGSLSLMFKILPTLNWSVGGGIIYYDLMADAISDHDLKLKESVPFFHLGIEVRPQARLGIGGRINYATKTAQGYIDGATTNNVALELEKLQYEGNLSIYF